MGRPKKNLEQQSNLEQTGLINTQEEKLEQPVVQQTIHEKYKKYIDQARSNYITGISYFEMMDMVGYISKKIGRNYPLNASCSSCIIQMIKYFASLK